MNRPSPEHPKRAPYPKAPPTLPGLVYKPDWHAAHAGRLAHGQAPMTPDVVLRMCLAALPPNPTPSGQMCRRLAQRICASLNRPGMCDEVTEALKAISLKNSFPCKSKG